MAFHVNIHQTHGLCFPCTLSIKISFTPFSLKHCVKKIAMVVVVGMEDRKKEDKLQAVWFAAGVAALMACLERAMLVSFVEQWRVIAFLALNLLLLAILFTSRSTIVEETSPECISNTTDQSKIEVRTC